MIGLYVMLIPTSDEVGAGSGFSPVYPGTVDRGRYRLWGGTVRGDSHEESVPGYGPGTQE